MVDKEKSSGAKRDELMVNKLRKKAYDQPDGTHIDGVQTARDLDIPVGREIYLEVKEGGKLGQKFKLTKGNVIIGRSRDEVDIVIDDDKISRKHALIEAFSRDLLFLSDLASTNGTYLNGMRVRSIKLKDGDTIKIGNTVFIFNLKDA